LEAAGLKVSAPSGKTVTLSDTAANIETLTTAEIAGLKAIGVTAVAANDVSVALSVAQAAAVEAAALKVSAPSGKTVTLSDTAVDIETNLTASEIAGLKAVGITGIAATDASVTLTVTQAIALEAAAMKATAPAGDFATLSDTAANIEALTATEIAGLKAIGVTAIAASDASALLSVAEAAALETAALKVSAPSRNFVTVSDTAADIETLTTTEIKGLKAIGVTGIATTDAAVLLTVAQAIALEGAGLTVSPPFGDAVTLSDTAAHIAALTAGQIVLLPTIGVTAIAATNVSVSLTVVQALALEKADLKVSAHSGKTVTLSDTSANIEALTATEIAGLEGTGIAAITSASLNVTLALALEGTTLKVSPASGKTVTLSDAAANIEGLSAAEIIGLETIGVTAIAATGASVALSVAQAAALETAALKVSAPSGKTVTLSDTVNDIEALTPTEIAGLKAIGVAGIAATDASLVLSAADAAAIETAGLTVSAPSGDTVSVSDTAANVAAHQSQLSALAATGEIAWIEQLNTDGSHTFSSIENGTTTAGTGADDTFVFAPSFGHDVIANFAASGATHDVLEFSASSFSYLTKGETQAADWAALLLRAVSSTAAGAMITDSKGDTVTLDKVAEATLALAANAGDFKFV
jgi:hypothetical protein